MALELERMTELSAELAARLPMVPALVTLPPRAVLIMFVLRDRATEDAAAAAAFCAVLFLFAALFWAAFSAAASSFCCCFSRAAASLAASASACSCSLPRRDTGAEAPRAAGTADRRQTEATC